MAEAPVRVLVVDDFEPWRRFASSALQKHLELEIIGEVADGLEAVQKVEELRPDLVLLDIGLPTLNGIEAAKRIRTIAPATKIIFVTQNDDLEVAKTALENGARGYVLKMDAKTDLPLAIAAVLRGGSFVSKRLEQARSD